MSARQRRREDVRRAVSLRLSSILDVAEKYNRDEIYAAIWAEPIQHVAKRYNISDVGLAKVCKKLNIPRPGRGYWAIKAAGRPLPKRPPAYSGGSWAPIPAQRGQ